MFSLSRSKYNKILTHNPEKWDFSSSYGFKAQESIMLFLFFKSLERKNCEEICYEMISYCDFWKYSKPYVLKIFLSLLRDFCRVFPKYFRNTQNLIDEITQILLQKKIQSLEAIQHNLNEVFTTKKPMEDTEELKDGESIHSEQKNLENIEMGKLIFNRESSRNIYYPT